MFVQCFAKELFLNIRRAPSIIKRNIVVLHQFFFARHRMFSHDRFLYYIRLSETQEYYQNRITLLHMYSNAVFGKEPDFQISGRLKIGSFTCCIILTALHNVHVIKELYLLYRNGIQCYKRRLHLRWNNLEICHLRFTGFTVRYSSELSNEVQIYIIKRIVYIARND